MTGDKLISADSHVSEPTDLWVERVARRVSISRRVESQSVSASGRKHFHEAALPVRSPHHGAPGETARPQRLHRVSCAAARRVRSRGSLTIAHRVSQRQRITVHPDRISERQLAQTRVRDRGAFAGLENVGRNLGPASP